MCHIGGTHLLANLLVPVAMLGALGLFFQWRNERMNEFSQWSGSSKACSVTAALVVITVMSVFKATQFIYFQF
jgi:hypothetical protein